jgi:Flp pilus assembly pilin Flp
MKFNFIRDQNGAVLVEVTVMLTVFFVFILGSIDFLMLFYQWNAAAKAVALGARIAAVSDPVALGLKNLSAVVVDPFRAPGTAMPAFAVTCDGATTRCICEGTCPGLGGYDGAAMDAIVYGRGSSSCFDATSTSGAGMCDLLPALTPSNVVIAYRQTGVGFAGRPGGPAPSISVSIKDLPFRFFFLGSLLGSNLIRMPTLTVSVLGEDMSSTAPVM